MLLVARQALLLSGWTDRQLDRRVAAGELIAVRGGVYVDEGAWALASARERVNAEVRAARAVMRADVVASHQTAALLLGIPTYRRPAYPIELTRALGPGEKPRYTGGSAVRVAGLPDHHRTVIDGTHTTNTARTVVDLARRYGKRAGVVAADFVLRAGLPRQELERVVQDCRRWPGVRTAKDALLFADPLSESPLESVGRVAMWELDLPAPRLQVWLGTSSTQRVRVDFEIAEYATVAEADGAVKYDGREVVLAEKRRDQFLNDLDREVVHFDWADCHGNLRTLDARFRRAFLRQGRRTA